MLFLVSTGLSHRCLLPCKTDKQPVHSTLIPVALKGSRDVGPARGVRKVSKWCFVFRVSEHWGIALWEILSENDMSARKPSTETGSAHSGPL